MTTMVKCMRRTVCDVARYFAMPGTGWTSHLAIHHTNIPVFIIDILNVKRTTQNVVKMYSEMNRK